MAGNGGSKPTPTSAQRFRRAAPDSTKAAQHRLPVSGAGPLTMTKRTTPTVVKGPGSWENGRDTTFTPAGQPPLRGTNAAGCMPGADCP